MSVSTSSAADGHLVVRDDQAVGDRDPLDGGVGQVPLVPERHVLVASCWRSRAGAGPARTAARSSSDCACAASRSSPDRHSSAALRPRGPRCAAAAGIRGRSAPRRRRASPPPARSWACRSLATTWLGACSTPRPSSRADVLPRRTGRSARRCPPSRRSCPPRRPSRAAAQPSRRAVDREGEARPACGRTSSARRGCRGYARCRPCPSASTACSASIRRSRHRVEQQVGRAGQGDAKRGVDQVVAGHPQVHPPWPSRPGCPRRRRPGTTGSRGRARARSRRPARRSGTRARSMSASAHMGTRPSTDCAWLASTSTLTQVA